MRRRPGRLGTLGKEENEKILKILLQCKLLQTETFQRGGSDFDKSELEHRVLRNKIHKKTLYQPGITSFHCDIIEVILSSLCCVLWGDFDATLPYAWFQLHNVTQSVRDTA